MDCERCAGLVDLYLDGELPAGEAAAFEAALATCPDCTARLDERRLLRAALRGATYHAAPPELRAALRQGAWANAESAAGTAGTAGAAGSARPRQRMAPALRWAAAVLISVALGWAIGRYGPQPADARLEDQVVAGFLRLSASEHPVDVASSNRHTVKPWFAGRIDFAPPVLDLTTEGFPLVGGRVDVVDGRKVAVLVYRRSQHFVALYLWPGEAAATPVRATRDGFAIRRWGRDRFVLSAVSDIAGQDLDGFVAAFDRRLAAEN